MNRLKKKVDSLLRLIDNGKFFREPMKWLYMLNGIVCMLIPIALFVVLYMFAEIDHLEGWSMLMGVLFLICSFVVCFIAAFFSLYFWLNRRRQLHSQVKEGDNIVVIPVWAHWIQAQGEWLGLFLGIIPPIVAALAFVCTLLSGFELFNVGGHFFSTLIKCLGIVIGVAVVSVLLGYAIVMVSHVLGEKLRIKASLANDVRDIGDIHRAAVMPNEESKEPVAPAE